MNPLLLLGLQTPAIPEGAGLGTGTQAVTVVVRGMPNGASIEAERVGMGKLLLTDPGVGYQTGTFRGEPARFTQLRLVMVTGGRSELIDTLVPLGDRDREVLSFEVVPGTVPRAVRTAHAPSASNELAVDPASAWAVRFGWGALALGYVTTLALGALRR